MRKRQEITESPKSYEELTLEILLDIRDLLNKGDECPENSIITEKEAQQEQLPIQSKDTKQPEVQLLEKKKRKKSARKSKKRSRTSAKPSSAKDAANAARKG